MGKNFGNVTKASYQADIKRKQAFFNRCKRRYKVANTPAERNWLKNEATKVCTELRQCSKKWKTYGFGGVVWITKNFTMTNFNAARSTVTNRTKSTCKTSARKTTTNSRTNNTRSRTSARKSPTTRSYARRTTSTRSRARTQSSRTRSNAARRTYSAW